MKVRDIIIVFCLLTIGIVRAEICSCPASTTPPKTPPDFSGAPVNEVIGGKDYGKLAIVDKFVFLQNDFDGDKGTKSIPNHCPNGYTLPTSTQYSDLIKTFKDSAEAYATLTKVDGLNLATKIYYLTNDKVYPNKTSGSDSDAWLFKALYLNPDTKVATVTQIQTYFNTAKTKSKCIRNSTVDLIVSVYPSDFTTAVDYQASISNVNIGNPVWKYDVQVKEEKSIQVNFPTSGCGSLQAWAKDLIGNVLYYCKAIQINDPYGSDGATTLAENNLKMLDLGVKAVPEKAIHFAKGAAPVAPKLKGGLYILYSDKTTSSLHVISIDENMKKTSDNDLKISGFPMDIVETTKGYVIYAKDNTNTNKSFVAGFTTTGVQLFLQTIMNNGSGSPTTATEQLIFNNSKGAPLFGMDVMYNPHNGKLAFGKDKFALVFAHYNHFGPSNDHTGDSHYVFDIDGKNPYLGFNWASSHSLIQSHIYDTTYYITAALGDAYPENIKVCFINPNSLTKDVDSVRKGTFTYSKTCKDVIDGGIPGFGNGTSCGRLGGLFQKGTTYGLVYSTNACKSSSRNQIGLITWNFNGTDLTNIKEYNLGQKASNLIGLRAGKYGENILVSWVTTDKDYGTEATPSSFTGAATEKPNYMLVSFTGTVVSKSFTPATFSIPQSDDLKILKDGTLAWTFVQADGTATLWYTDSPPQKFNPITTPSDSTSSSSGSTTSSSGTSSTSSRTSSTNSGSLSTSSGSSSTSSKNLKQTKFKHGQLIGSRD